MADTLTTYTLSVLLLALTAAALSVARYYWRRARLLDARLDAPPVRAAAPPAPPSPAAPAPAPSATPTLPAAPAPPPARAPDPPSVEHDDIPDGAILHLRMPVLRLFETLALLRQAVISNADFRLLLETVGDEATHLGRMVSELLAFTEKKELRPRRVALQPLAEAVVGKCLTDMGSLRPISLAIDVGSPGLVLADPELLEAALTHLVRNAIEAMPRGGTLGISATPAVIRGKAGVALKVSDSGVGLADDLKDVASLFEPFVTTHSDAPGLGLAVVKQVAEAHGGVALLERRPGKGVVATLHLPGAHLAPVDADAAPDDDGGAYDYDDDGGEHGVRGAGDRVAD